MEGNGPLRLKENAEKDFQIDVTVRNFVHWRQQKGMCYKNYSIQGIILL